METTTINLETITINLGGIDFPILKINVTGRGGSIIIGLAPIGRENDQMYAYQNYLGGGMLGKVCSHNTVFNPMHPFADDDLGQLLNRLEEGLRQYFFSLTNPEGCWEEQSYEDNQKMPVSGY